MIGKTVTVTVDRPLGSAHPDYPEMIYPINYGYIEGIMAPDGEEQDAYILGVSQPVERFTGRIIAIVRRADDVAGKNGSKAEACRAKGQAFDKVPTTDLAHGFVPPE